MSANEYGTSDRAANREGEASGELPNTDAIARSKDRDAGLIEIGVLIAGPLDDVDRRATSIAIDQAVAFLTETFPGFRFEVTTVRRPELAGNGRVEPSLLLQQAVEDRNARHWDFALVVTAAELVGNYSPYCFAALSRPLDAAVFSLSLIDPQAIEAVPDPSVRVDRIARRLSRLMLHAIGHLSGLPRSADGANLLYHPALASDLDAMQNLTAEQFDKHRTALKEIADQRLEESPQGRSNRVVFTLRAAWINRREIVEAIWAARPWQFPIWLSRLTIASVSSAAILLLTAEAWDLALSQSTARVVALTMLSWLSTTLYVIVRQQLLIRRGRQHSEQTVVTSVSSLGIVLIGMSVTWVMLVVFGLVLAGLLFDPELITDWAASSDVERAGMAAMIRMGCFSASLALLIGALGASFEAQHYFRHVIYVDEEI